MARFRSIHAAVWENKDLRRLGWVARNVFLYLFSKAADDEGRFRADSYSILEGAFGRGDPVTEADVTDAMQSLADIEEPMVLLYGEHGQYGFLSGWFMHQYMQARYREESALPPPPVEVSSWAKADEVRDRYMAEKRLGKTASYRDAIRWFVGLSLESGQANSGGSIEAHQSDSREALENLQANRKGKGNRKGSTPSAPPCDAGPEKQKKRRKETPDQVAIRETFEKLTGLDWPGGSPKGYSGLAKEVTNRGRSLLLEWAASGHTSTDPKDATNLVGWFFTTAPECMRQAFNWRKRDNGPDTSHLTGWDLLASVEGVEQDRSQWPFERSWPPEVCERVAAHPRFEHMPQALAAVMAPRSAAYVLEVRGRLEVSGGN